MKKLAIMISVLAVLSLSFANVAQQSAYDLFQKALAKERAEGNLEEAISLYQKVMEVAKEKTLAAEAQLHIGLCYEKLGKTEAIKAYEQVLKNFPGQSKQVAAARERLSALKKEEPSGPYRTKIFEGELAALVQDISPDGTKLALSPIDDKGINIAVYDLSTKQMDYVTHYGWEKQVHFAKWSPDGNKIVFHQSGLDPAGPAEIAVSTLEGKTRVLYRVENMKEGYPVPYAWLPDGSAILTGIFHEDKTGPIGGTLGLIPLSGGSFKGFHSMKDTDQMSHEIADVSPDGRFVVFQDMNPQGKYDLYIIGTDGSSLEVLSNHPADEGLPRWSPDGKHIVFGSLRHGRPALWGIGVKGGKPVGEPFFIKEGLNLSPQSLLNWTKQGLAYKESIMVQDIYIVSIDPDSLKITGKPRQIEYTPTGGNVCPSWSPNGKDLAFVAINQNQLTGENKIVVAPVNGGEPQEFLNAAKYRAALAIHDLRWLPDGSGLSLSDFGRGKKSTLHQLDLKTGEWKKWPIPVKSWTRTEWNADGKSFLYARHGFRHDMPGIIEHNLETGAERYVYKPEGELGSVFRQLKCSRDYTKLVFTEDNARIKLVDLKTGEQRDVSSEYKGALAWSPNAKHLISTGETNKLGFPTAMFILNVTDGSARKLDLGFPKGKTFLSPTWSPDGKQIAFMAQSQKYEIFLMKNIVTK